MVHGYSEPEVAPYPGVANSCIIRPVSLRGKDLWRIGGVNAGQFLHERFLMSPFLNNLIDYPI